MKILVTGHEGFIGRNMLAWCAAEEGWQVDGYEWHPTERPDVSSYDYVIHLGAIADMTCKDVEAIMRQNLEFSQWLFNECNHHGVHLQYASSSSVYGDSKDFSETAQCYPQTPYAWSKYLFDRWWPQQDVKIMVQGFRYFNVYGDGEAHKGSQASPVTQFRKQAKEQGFIKLFEDSNSYFRDFICVEDVCRVHVEFIKSVKKSGIFNVGTGKTYSFQQVADLISDKQQYIPMPEILKNSYQTYTCSDNTELENMIGPQEWITIEEFLKLRNN